MAYRDLQTKPYDLKFADVIQILNQIKLDKPKPEVPQMIFDVIKSFDDDVDYLHQHMSQQSDEVREWLTHNEREFYEAWLAYPNAAKSVTYLSKNSDGKAEVANKEIEKVTNLVNYYDKKQT